MLRADDLCFGSRERFGKSAVPEDFNPRRRFDRRGCVVYNVFDIRLDTRVSGEEPRNQHGDCHRNYDAEYGKDHILGAV